MQMYSADIFISATAVFLAANELEARQMNDQAKETALTIPQDKFFTDRNFSDPLLADLTLATTFTYWTLLKDKRLTTPSSLATF
ncbi:hypothetical protein [Neorhizobium tomejilense]|uniref:hypothetical protein n=1 Tax=Neorhizobium tomejilense TaxID=2093828 RepID=UPI000CF9A252|nr:hypothetical protein [Neorhizobium tomejilense]